jgi:hypothetical protein
VVSARVLLEVAEYSVGGAQRAVVLFEGDATVLDGCCCIVNKEGVAVKVSNNPLPCRLCCNARLARHTRRKENTRS